jgi:spermidine synthase
MARKVKQDKTTVFPYIAICFILSGAASLALEVTWSKYLSLLLGSTVYGVATVVGSFMAGLGLGSYIAGKLSGRLRNHVRAYAWLEGAVGLFALLSPLLFRNISPVFGKLFDLSFQSLTLFLAARFTVLFLILLIPTIAMGASLPILAEYFARREPASRGHIGALYALNTIGAVLGTTMAGFVFIPRWGLARSTITAALIDLAILAFLLLRPFPPASPMEEKSPKDLAKQEQQIKGPFQVFWDFMKVWRGPFIALLFGLSGLLAMAYQIGWTRILIVSLGSSVYCFTIILALYLTGLSLGSALISRLAERTQSPLAWFGFLEGIVALTVYSGTFWFGKLPQLTAWAFRASEGHPLSFYLYETLIAAPIVLPPTLALGALFPIAARSYREVVGKTGRAVGTIYAANTLGTILGSLGAGFLLVPLIGTRKTVLMAAVASAVVGLLALALAPRARNLKIIAATIAVVAIIGATARPPLIRLSDVNYGIVSILRDEHKIQAGKTLPKDDLSKQRIPQQQSPSLERLIYYREGLNAAVAVSADDRHRFLIINGKGDASTIPVDMKTQTLLGHLPMMFAPRSQDVLVIGLGAGVTTHAVLTYPDVKRVDTVEIEAGVIEASDFFKDVNGEALQDPRSHLVIDDARIWLSYTEQEYDVIISEPSNPWIAGINSLFTLDFYHQVDQKLRPAGIFCQWIHTYEISEDSVYTVLRTIGRVFSNVTIFSNYNDMLIIAQEDPRLKPSVDYAFSLPAVASDLADIGMKDPTSIAPHYKASLKQLLAGRKEGPLNTDDNCYLEHKAPLELINPRTRLFSFYILKSYFDDFHSLFFPNRPEGEVLFESGRSAAQSEDLEYAAWALEICEDRGYREAAALLRPEIERAHQQRATQDTIKDYLRKAEELQSRNQSVEAYRTLEAAGRLDPKDNEVLARAAMILMEMQRQEPAEQFFQLLIRRNDPDYLYMAHVNLGVMLFRRQAYEEALVEFDRAREVNPYLGPAYQFGAMTLDRMDKLGEAIKYVKDGLVYGSEDPLLLNQTAFLLEKKGDYKEARRLKRRAARLSPKGE